MKMSNTTMNNSARSTSVGNIEVGMLITGTMVPSIRLVDWRLDGPDIYSTWLKKVERTLREMRLSKHLNGKGD